MREVSPRQIIHLTDRLDYLSAIMNNWGVAKAVEKAAGIETNGRIETIRTLMSELQRIQSHMLWWGVLGMDLGAFTAFLYAFRDREIISELFEETVGARLTMNYVRPGGVMFDIHPDFPAKVKKLPASISGRLSRSTTRCFPGNVILQERLRNIGVIEPEQAVALGCTGPVLRGSGVPLDLRKLAPYGRYGDVEFNVAIGTRGDCWDRYYVRMEEIRQSMRIIGQLSRRHSGRAGERAEGQRAHCRPRKGCIATPGRDRARCVRGHASFPTARAGRTGFISAPPISTTCGRSRRLRPGGASPTLSPFSPALTWWSRTLIGEAMPRPYSTYLTLAAAQGAGFKTVTVAEQDGAGLPDGSWILALAYMAGALAGVGALVTAGGAVLIYAERKIAGHFQCRLGPDARRLARHLADRRGRAKAAT